MAADLPGQLLNLSCNNAAVLADTCYISLVGAIILLLPQLFVARGWLN